MGTPTLRTQRRRRRWGDIAFILTHTSLVSQDDEEEQEVARVDLTRPLCSDYAALGYKCVQFWECGEDGNILDRWIQYSKVQYSTIQ